jgi:hypothetical protein
MQTDEKLVNIMELIISYWLKLQERSILMFYLILQISVLPGFDHTQRQVFGKHRDLRSGPDLVAGGHTLVSFCLML